MIGVFGFRFWVLDVSCRISGRRSISSILVGSGFPQLHAGAQGFMDWFFYLQLRALAALEFDNVDNRFLHIYHGSLVTLTCCALGKMPLHAFVDPLIGAIIELVHERPIQLKVR